MNEHFWTWLFIVIVVLLVVAYVWRKMKKTPEPTPEVVDTSEGDLQRANEYFKADEEKRNIDPVDALAGHEKPVNRDTEKLRAYETAYGANRGIVESLADLDTTSDKVYTGQGKPLAPAEDTNEDENVVQFTQASTTAPLVADSDLPADNPVEQETYTLKEETKPLTGAAVGKVSDAGVRDIRTGKLSIEAYAAKYFVSTATVKRIQAHKTYRDVV